MLLWPHLSAGDWTWSWRSHTSLSSSPHRKFLSGGARQKTSQTPRIRERETGAALRDMASLSIRSRHYGSFQGVPMHEEEAKKLVDDARLSSWTSKRQESREEEERTRRVRKCLPKFFGLVPWLKYLCPHWRALVVNLVEPGSFRRGEVMCENGDASYIYIITGEAMVTDLTTQIKRVNAGEVFHGEELCSVSERAELRCSKSTCLAAVLNAAALDSLAEAHPEAHRYILRHINVIGLWFGGDRHGASVRHADEVQEWARNLREAAKEGEVGKLQLLLEPRNRHLVDAADPSTLQNSALHAAALGGHRGAVVFLLEAGACPNIRDRESYTPLHAAAMSGDSEIAKRLIEHGAHVDWSNDSFRTPLHVCAQQGTVEVMRVLLDAGAKVDVQDSNGISPFHLAVGYRKTEAVRTLLLGGVNMQKRNFHGRWGLHEAQFWREFEFERTAEEAYAEGVIKNIMLKVCRKEINMTEVEIPSSGRNRDYLLDPFVDTKDEEDDDEEDEVIVSRGPESKHENEEQKEEEEEESAPVRDSAGSRSSFHLV